MRPWMVLVAVSWLALGCGGTDEGGVDRGGAGMSAGGRGPFDAGSDPNRNQVAPGTICQRLATIQCAGASACCDNPRRTFDDCKRTAEQACAGSFAFDQVAAAAEVAFEAAAAGMAFGELERRASMCDPAVASWAASSVGFSMSFRGTLGAGENCMAVNGLDATTGELGIALASCRIGEGLACLPAASGWTCVACGSAGSPCFTDLNCVDGLYCQSGGGPYDGLCTARKNTGDACASPVECSSFLCVNDACASGTDVQAAYCF